MRRVLWSVAVFAMAVMACCSCYSNDQAVVRYRGDGSDLQQIIDACVSGATVECGETEFTFMTPLIISKPLTVKGLRARLPEKLGRTSLIEVKAEGVTLLDLELHGNYDSVSQDERRPLVWISKGNFRIERCQFYDSTKDGVMITPEVDEGDLVSGVVRDIQAERMGRDAVSIGGGTWGAKVKNVTVDNVRVDISYHRGAVEVSDGTENITVRNVKAFHSLYAVDVQDHKRECAANVNVLLENIEATDCVHIVRTANSPRGHANLVMQKLSGVRCKRPLVISHTDNVILDGATITDHPTNGNAPLQLSDCHGVLIRNLIVAGDSYRGDVLRMRECSGVVSQSN